MSYYVRRSTRSASRHLALQHAVQSEHIRLLIPRGQSGEKIRLTSKDFYGLKLYPFNLMKPEFPVRLLSFLRNGSPCPGRFKLSVSLLVWSGIPARLFYQMERQIRIKVGLQDRDHHHAPGDRMILKRGSKAKHCLGLRWPTACHLEHYFTWTL